MCASSQYPSTEHKRLAFYTCLESSLLHRESQYRDPQAALDRSGLNLLRSSKHTTTWPQAISKPKGTLRGTVKFDRPNGPLVSGCIMSLFINIRELVPNCIWRTIAPLPLRRR